MLIHLQGFSTAPNSPSVNSRSSSLGSSLSLGNVSGMTANPEVKKRRAPPPPVATPVLPNAEVRGRERTAAQVTATPLNGLLCLVCWVPLVLSAVLKPFTGILVGHYLQLTKTPSCKTKLSKVLVFCTHLLSSLETAPSFLPCQEPF